MSDETVEPAPIEPRRPRWLYSALIASMALNLLLLGGAAGAMFRHRHDHPRERGLMDFVRDLPQERRGDVQSFLKGEREKLKPMRDEVKASWSETNAALGEEPFDKEKLKAAMDRMVAAEMRVRMAISDAVVETAGKLTAQERKALQAWRARTQEHGRKKRKQWEDERGGERE